MAGSKGSKYYDIFLDYSIRLEHKQLGSIINYEGFALLYAIEKTSSLKEAANELDISYRKAWNQIQDIEKSLNLKLVERHRGGVQGGKTELSEDGQRLLNAHRELRTEFDKSIHTLTKKFFHDINQ